MAGDRGIVDREPHRDDRLGAVKGLESGLQPPGRQDRRIARRGELPDRPGCCQRDTRELPLCPACAAWGAGTHETHPPALAHDRPSVSSGREIAAALIVAEGTGTG